MTIEKRYLEPDWSKAPADAEYYVPMNESGSFFPVWIRGDLDGRYDIAFALKDDNEGDFINFTIKTPYWSEQTAVLAKQRTEYYKSALVPRPASDSENDWVNA